MNVKDTLEKMTLCEKAQLCSGLNSWQTKSFQRISIKSIFLSDGPHGLRKMKDPDDSGIEGSEPATCFPTPSALASSWNDELIHSVGVSIAKEAVHYGVDVLLGPGVNIKRTPLCGRNFEYYSEDPYLSSEMAISFIRGVQEMGVGTSLKHFACNNQEYHRMSISAQIDEKTLFETYLYAFRRIIKKTNPWTVMCSYNRINGIYSSENVFLLKEILRESWNYDGMIISDWGAIWDRVKSMKATLDLEMPGPSQVNDKKIIEEIESGELKKETLDFSVENILNLIEKTKNSKPDEKVDFEENHELAVKAAVESIVLLKNQNGILPLNRAKIGSIGIIGSFAKNPRIQGLGSSRVNPTHLRSPFDCIKEYLNDETKVYYSKGYTDEDIVDENLIDEALEIAGKTDFVLIFSGLPEYIESEGYDRNNLELPEAHSYLIKKICEANNNSIVVLNNGSAITGKEWIDSTPGLIEGWLAGQGFGEAITKILFGDENPSGKLSETFPVKLEDTPAFLNYPGENDEVFYGEGNFVGYKYYDKKKIKPLFPFGYGMSYSKFRYENCNLDKTVLRKGEKVGVEITVKNESEIAGKEIIQVYLKPVNSKYSLPEKSLGAYSKLYIEADESRRAFIEIDYDSFEHYDTAMKKWVVYPGEYELLIGSSSSNIKFIERITVLSDIDKKDLINKFSILKEWLEIPDYREVLDEFFDRFIGIDSVEDYLNGLEDEFRRMVLEMPVKNVFSMLIKDIPVEEVIDKLLIEVKSNDKT